MSDTDFYSAPGGSPLDALNRDDEPVLRRRLLFAQDQEIPVLVVPRQLTEAGFDVVGQAGDPSQAAGLITALRPDATLLDIRNGLRAVAALRDQRLGPVVMLADKPAPGLAKDADGAGVMALVLTPFTRQRLLLAIELAVARHADTTALRAETVDISDRLDARKIIERAKGLLMTRQRITEPEAFRFLQKAAMNQRKSMRDIAQTVINQLSAA